LSNRFDGVKGRHEAPIDGARPVSGIAIQALAPAVSAPDPTLAAVPPLSAPTLAETARDAQIPDLAATSASVNQLQDLASSIPPPALPTTQQQSQAQQAAAQAPFKQDAYADGDDGTNPLGG
jgi:hypothetical protein